MESMPAGVHAAIKAKARHSILTQLVIRIVKPILSFETMKQNSPRVLMRNKCDTDIF